MGWRCSKKRPPSLHTSLTPGCSCGGIMGHLAHDHSIRCSSCSFDSETEVIFSLSCLPQPVFHTILRDILPGKRPFLAPGNPKGHLCPPQIPWSLAQGPASSFSLLLLNPFPCFCPPSFFCLYIS